MAKYSCKSEIDRDFGTTWVKGVVKADTPEEAKNKMEAQVENDLLEMNPDATFTILNTVVKDYESGDLLINPLSDGDL